MVLGGLVYYFYSRHHSATQVRPYIQAQLVLVSADPPVPSLQGERASLVRSLRSGTPNPAAAPPTPKSPVGLEAVPWSSAGGGGAKDLGDEGLLMPAGGGGMAVDMGELVSSDDSGTGGSSGGGKAVGRDRREER